MSSASYSTRTSSIGAADGSVASMGCGFRCRTIDAGDGCGGFRAIWMSQRRKVRVEDPIGRTPLTAVRSVAVSKKYARSSTAHHTNDVAPSRIRCPAPASGDTESPPGFASHDARRGLGSVDERARTVTSAQLSIGRTDDGRNSALRRRGTAFACLPWRCDDLSSLRRASFES